MRKNKWKKKKYEIVYDYVEGRLLELKNDSNNIVGELMNYEQIPLEYRYPLVSLNLRYENVKEFIDTLNSIKTEVNQETRKIIVLLYFQNKTLEEVSYITNIKKDRLKFRHKMLVDEVMEQMHLYNGAKRRYSNGKRRNSIPKYVMSEVRKRDNNCCTKCETNENLHFHHKVRYADGGQDTVDNLTLLCVKCHAEEHKNENVYHILKSQAEKVIM